MTYQIKIEKFEGPLDLLLNLISRQKIDVYEISISEIIKSYLAYIDQMEELDLEISSEFILMMAMLLDIKAANLLPQKEEAIFEEDITPQEARDLLIARLIEYKKFKNVAAELAARYDAESKYFVRDVALEEEFQNLMPDFLAGVSIRQIRAMFNAVNEKKEITILQADHITPKPLSVDEYVKRIEKRLKGSKVKSFRDVTKDCESKVEIITSFLALLELYKQGVVELGQVDTFGEITIIMASKTGVVS